MKNKHHALVPSFYHSKLDVGRSMFNVHPLFKRFFLTCFGLNKRQCRLELTNTSMDGICRDLKSMALQPWGNDLSQVT
jgi:hypothetical protein